MQRFELVLLVRDMEANATARFDIHDDDLVDQVRRRLAEDPPNKYSVGGWRGGILSLHESKAEQLLAAPPRDDPPFSDEPPVASSASD